MTDRITQLTDDGGGTFAAVRQLNAVSIAPVTFNFRSNTTINKTWHADCRKSVVSKILDWLVI